MEGFDAVYAVKCDTYGEEKIASALQDLLVAPGLLDFVHPGMKIALKVNLVSAMTPDTAATTHPAVIAGVCRLIRERGGEPIVGDSPGGPFTEGYLEHVYRVTGLDEYEKQGLFTLNRNVEQTHALYEEGKSLQSFDYTAWLDGADAVVNICKLKTHGMMGMSAAVKNLFGTIPGTKKPEYHFRFPEIPRFADMLVDLNRFFKPSLQIVDAVVGMEGNGPTAGTPRQIGALLASASPFCLDLVCASLIGLKTNDVPTLRAAADRRLAPEKVEDVTLEGEIESLKVSDYKLVNKRKNLDFSGLVFGPLGKVVGGFVARALDSHPDVKKKDCIGCGKCDSVCPAKAIVMKKGRDGRKIPSIDRKKCIRCFCCQEFCPKGAMKVRRTLIARILSK